MTFEQTHVDYLVGVARAFETVGPCMFNVVWKVWKAYVLRWKSFEDVSAVSHHTECEDMVAFQDDHTLYMLR